jgi:uncharacterized membrane protein YhaH (DUF805 family)
MPHATFRIRFDGTLTPGADVDKVKANLARMFQQDVTKIERLFEGRTVTIKRGLSEANARKYVESMYQAGAVARMEDEESVAPKLVAPPKEGQEVLPEPLRNAERDKAPVSVSNDLQNEEYCELGWFSSQERIGRLRLMARSGVLMGMMFIVAFVGNGIIAHVIPTVVGLVLAAILAWVVALTHRVRSSASFLDMRSGLSLLDMSWLLGVPAFLILLAVMMGTPNPTDPQGLARTGIFTNILLVVAWILLMTQQIHRLHDCNRSGWWSLLFLIPYLGLLLFLPLVLQGGDENSNEYGVPPPPNTLGVNLGVALFVAMSLFAFLGWDTAHRLETEAPTITKTPTVSVGMSPGDNSSILRLRHLPDDFARYASKRFNLSYSFREAGDMLHAAENNALALEQWKPRNSRHRFFSPHIHLESKDPVSTQLQKIQKAIRAHKDDRDYPVSPTGSLLEFSDLYMRGIGRIQGVLERLENLCVTLVSAHRSTLGNEDKTAFQINLDNFKRELDVLKQDYETQYAQTRQEMCAYLKNPDDLLREYLNDPKRYQTEYAEWCN